MAFIFTISSISTIMFSIYKNLKYNSKVIYVICYLKIIKLELYPNDILIIYSI